MIRYTLTFVALIGLTLLTLGLSYLDLGTWNTVLALSIAMAKALLIAFFFMHLAEQRTSARVTALVAVVLIAAFIGLATLDVSSRNVQAGRGAALPELPAAPR